MTFTRFWFYLERLKIGTPVPPSNLGRRLSRRVVRTGKPKWEKTRALTVQGKQDYDGREGGTSQRPYGRGRNWRYPGRSRLVSDKDGGSATETKSYRRRITYDSPLEGPIEEVLQRGRRTLRHCSCLPETYNTPVRPNKTTRKTPEDRPRGPYRHTLLNHTVRPTFPPQ